MRRHRRIIGILAVGAATALAALLFVAVGPADAVLTITMVALLTGLYLLRRHARTTLVYRPRTRVPSEDVATRKERHDAAVGS